MGSRSRVAATNLSRQILANIPAYLSGQASIPIAGTTYTPATLVASVQEDIDSADRATLSREAFINATVSDRARRKKRKAFHAGLRAYLENLYDNPEVVGAFGFPPRKATTPSVEAKAQAVAKRAATRKARHTMGKRQKAAIKGDVTGVKVIAVTTPAAAPSPSLAAGEEGADHVERNGVLGCRAVHE